MEAYQLDWLYLGDLDVVTRTRLRRARQAYDCGSYSNMASIATDARLTALECSKFDCEAVAMMFIAAAYFKERRYSQAGVTFIGARVTLGRLPSIKQRINEVVALYMVGRCYMNHQPANTVSALARWQRGLATLKPARWFYMVEGWDDMVDVADEVKAELEARITDAAGMTELQRRTGCKPLPLRMSS